MNWSDYFEYTEGLLTWKAIPGSKVKVGKVAGTLTPRGYISVALFGKKYRAHRIIWEMHYGPVPAGKEIDHINGKRAENQIENLRLATSGENHRNMGKRSDNTSGTTGVTFCKVLRKWKAYIKQQRKLIHLGCFTDINDAIAARKAAEVFYGFSERHGS